MNKSKKKEKPIEEHRVYIEYAEHRFGGEVIDPEDQWSCREDASIEVNFIRLHKQPPEHRFFYDSIVINNPDLLKLNELYLAVIRYSTGDTFGHTTGAWHIVGAAPTYKIAELMLNEALNSSKENTYKPWEGYFERFENTEVHKLDLT